MADPHKAVQSSAAILNELYELAGRPPYTTISVKSEFFEASLSASTVGNLLNGTTTPRVATVESFILACLALMKERGLTMRDQKRSEPNYWLTNYFAALRAESAQEKSANTRKSISGQLRGVPVPIVTRITKRDEHSKALLGREAEIRELLAGLTDETAASSVWILTGMAGIGKTALAHYVAGAAVSSEWFAGGALFVDLLGYAGEQDIAAAQLFGPILHRLGMPADEISVDLGLQAASYHEFLDTLASKGRPVLLLFDNVVSAKQVQPLIPTSPLHRVVLTGREALDVERARTINLKLLTAEASEHLLARCTDPEMQGDRRLQDDAVSRHQLIDLCGRLPLAIEIVGAILKSETELTPSTLATEILDTTDLGSFAFGERDLARIFETSWKRLRRRNEKAAELFLLLPIIPGHDFSTDVVAALADERLAIVRQRLRALTSAHLIDADFRGRYRIHILLHRYANGKPIPSETENAAGRRVYIYYAITSDSADDQLRAAPGTQATDRFSAHDEALEWFDAEISNLLRVMHVASLMRLDWIVVLIGQALPEYFELRGLRLPRLTAARLQLSAASRLGSMVDIGVAFNNLGLALDQLWKHNEAIESYEQAFSIFEELHDDTRKSWVINNLGIAFRKARRYLESVRLHELDSSNCRKAGDKAGEAAALNNLGLALLDMGDYDRATGVQRQAISLYEALGDEASAASCLVGLGAALSGSDRPEEAIEVLEQAVAACSAYFHRREASAWSALGEAYQASGRIADSISALENAVIAHKKRSDIRGELGAWHALGVSLGLADRKDESVAAHRRAVEQARVLSDALLTSECLQSLATALRNLGHLDEADTVARDAERMRSDSVDAEDRS